MSTNETLDSLPANAANELFRFAVEDTPHHYSFAGGYIASMFEHNHLNERQLLDAMTLLNRIRSGMNGAHNSFR